ncbi:hypothetical protein H8356DRAFT_1375356 [Neocallimastix lanati (nom. inval.)]|nr:hypothetical protein H8356DRAFT_1375356 [Neocallimastix sp. JGI-2020a]
MVFFSAIISIVLVENVLSAINRENQYIELDNTTTEAYFCIEEDNCNVLSNCYNRNEHTGMRFVPNNRDNPDDCDIKGYVNIKSYKCYFTSNRSVVYQDPNSKTNVEIDLTEYGCCTITRDDKDTKWIENLPHHIQINQINIPGTHNSGTYAIGETGFKFLFIREATMIALKRQIFMTN